MAGGHDDGRLEGSCQRSVPSCARGRDHQVCMPGTKVAQRSALDGEGELLLVSGLRRRSGATADPRSLGVLPRWAHTKDPAVNILVVDDSQAMRALVKRALSKISRFSEASFRDAADGRQALAAIQEDEPDLVLSDWNMPEMTGIELLQALNDAGISVPFGFVTSESTPEMYELARAHGARFMVSKPFTSESLDRALEGVV